MRRNLLVGGSLLALAAAAFTARQEGTIHPVYLDPVGKPTWCSGETNDSLGKKIIVGKTTFTPDECTLLLQRSLTKHNAPLERLDYELTSGQHVAFVDFIYNVGESKFNKSTMAKLLIAGKPRAACDELYKWRFMAGRDCSIASNKCGGIWKRRQEEHNICVNDDPDLIKLAGLPIGGEE